MITLYAATIDLDCFAVRLALRVAGLEHTREPVDMFPGTDEQSRKHLELAPRRELPILVCGPAVVSGLVPVLRHIAVELAPDAGLAPQADAEPWLDLAAGGMRAVHAARTAGLTGTGATDEQLRAARTALLVLDDHLTERRLLGRRWVAGDRPSVADLALYPPAALVRDLDMEPGEFPALRAWCRDVRLLAPDVAMPGILDPL